MANFPINGLPVQRYPLPYGHIRGKPGLQMQKARTVAGFRIFGAS